MNAIPDNLLIFLNQNRVITVCLVDNKNHPYCINCFYVFDEHNKCLIFKSSHGTYHQGLIIDSASVSGTILPEKIDTLKLRGIQFTGKLISSTEVETLNLNSKYLQKYPFSIAIMGYIWAVKLEFLKFTDNTLGFGNKTIWNSKTERD